MNWEITIDGRQVYSGVSRQDIRDIERHYKATVARMERGEPYKPGRDDYRQIHYTLHAAYAAGQHVVFAEVR